MIAVTTEQGFLLRGIPETAVGNFGFHPLFGFISEQAASDRDRHRKLHGMRSSSKASSNGNWKCRFAIGRGGANWFVEPIADCAAEALPDNSWRLTTTFGNFYLSNDAALDPARLPVDESSPDRQWKALTAVVCALLLLPLWLRTGDRDPHSSDVVEPIVVSVKQPTRRMELDNSVRVPDALPKTQAKPMDRQQSSAIAQNLGFLNVLGKKDLSKAIGGTPSQLSQASPGAGSGGPGSSGGELLSGLGHGVRRTTVGNSGIAGLGGLAGKTGAGGGLGGYGSGLVGSGNGRSLSALPLAQDAILEGGLEKSVIGATIARYLNQVRACYEAALRDHPGLSGQVTMDFEIAGSGKLNFARVGKSSLGNIEVPECIAGRMLEWQFPKPLGGVTVKVSYPFLLRPVNS